MYDRILVPLDGSTLAEEALPYAALLPSRRARVLRIVPNDVDDAGQAEASSYLTRVAAPLAAGDRTVETAVDRGNPAERIVAAAAESDLVVMTSRGHGAGGRRLFGSVADLVARHAPVPTLLLRGGFDPVPFAPPTRVVIPLDGSRTAERAVPIAAAMARSLGLPLHLVSVVEVDAGEETPASIRQPLADRLATTTARLHADGLAATSEVRSGSPADELLAIARPGDLVAMTTHGGGGGQRWIIGAVAEALVRQAPAPVVLVRADAQHAGPPPSGT